MEYAWNMLVIDEYKYSTVTSTRYKLKVVASYRSERELVNENFTGYEIEANARINFWREMTCFPSALQF